MVGAPRPAAATLWRGLDLCLVASGELGRDVGSAKSGLRPTDLPFWLRPFLQFRRDHLLKLYDVSREFADSFRQFLSGHRFLVEGETERFLVE